MYSPLMVIYNFSDDLDRKLQAQKLAQVMDQRFVHDTHFIAVIKPSMMLIDMKSITISI